MAVLLDNDVVLKLAQLDLLADGCKLLTSKYGQLYVLDTLVYQLRGKSSLRRYGAAALERVQQCLSQGTFLMFEELITVPRLIHLQNNFENLDEGEMRLLQGLLNHQDLLLSGDKRFLKAIAEKYQLEIDELLSFHNSKVGITQQLFGDPIPFHIGQVYISFDDVQ